MAKELMTTDDLAEFSPALKQAQMLAQTDMVPKRFRGKTATVATLINMAQNAGMDWFPLMRSCFEINGEFGLDSKAAIAMLNKSGRTVGPPRYEIDDRKVTKDNLDHLKCTVTVTDAATGQDISHTFHYSTAKKQGWTRNSHWVNDPRLMCMYRSAIQMIRTSYPDVLFGMYTVDEIRDSATVEGSVVSKSEPTDRDLALLKLGKTEVDTDGQETENTETQTESEVETGRLFPDGHPDAVAEGK